MSPNISDGFGLSVAGEHQNPPTPPSPPPSPLFTPQTLHPDILRKQKPQTWHHVFLPTYGRAEADDAQRLKLLSMYDSDYILLKTLIYLYKHMTIFPCSTSSFSMTSKMPSHAKSTQSPETRQSLRQAIGAYKVSGFAFRAPCSLQCLEFRG